MPKCYVAKMSARNSDTACQWQLRSPTGCAVPVDLQLSSWFGTWLPHQSLCACCNGRWSFSAAIIGWSSTARPTNTYCYSWSPHDQHPGTLVPAALLDPAITLTTFRQMLKSFLFWLTDVVFVSWHSGTHLWDVC